MRLDGTTAPGLPLPALAVVVPARAETTSASAATKTTAERFRLLPSSSDPDQVTLSRSLPLEVPSLPIVGVPFAVCAAWPQFMSLHRGPGHTGARSWHVARYVRAWRVTSPGRGKGRASNGGFFL